MGGTHELSDLVQLTKTLCLSFLACKVELIIASSLQVRCIGPTPGKSLTEPGILMSVSSVVLGVTLVALSVALSSSGHSGYEESLHVQVKMSRKPQSRGLALGRL